MFLIDLKTFKNIKNTEAPESETWDLWFWN